jgi:O-antigen ligase
MKRSISILPESSHKARTLHMATTVLFLALFAFPVLPLKITNALLMAWSVLSLIGFIMRPSPVKKELLRNLVFVIPFIPYLIEFCISGSEPTARFEVEKKLFFLTAPFMFPLFSKGTGFTNYRLALGVFSLSVASVTLYSLVGLIVKGISLFPSYNDIATQLLRTTFEDLSGLHPTYYAMFAVTAICFLFFGCQRYSRVWRILTYVLIALLLFTVLVLAVRIALIALVALLLLWFLSRKGAWLKRLMFTAAALVVLLGMVFFVPSLHTRFSELFDWMGNKQLQSNTISQRATIMDCSLKVLGEHPLLGTGSRAYQRELNECYTSKGWPETPDRSYNPHNQYLSIGISYGLLTLAAFLFTLFLLARNTRNIHEARYFILASLVFFMSESILERQMGVYFFGLIALLFFDSTLQSPKIQKDLPSEN